jgi:hypothetical protein
VKSVPNNAYLVMVTLVFTVTTRAINSHMTEQIWAVPCLQLVNAMVLACRHGEDCPSLASGLSLTVYFVCLGSRSHQFHPIPEEMEIANGD